MFEGVSGQSRMVRLYIDLEMLIQVMRAQETQHRGRVKVILVLRRFMRLGLDQELALETDLLLVVNCQLKKLRKLFLLLAQLGVEQRFISLAPAPEDVVFAAQFVGRVDRMLQLRRSISKDMNIRIGARSVSVARIGKKIGRAPKQFQPRILLHFFRQPDDVLEVFARLREIGPLGSDIPIMKTIVGHAELLAEFEIGLQRLLRHLQRRAGIPLAHPRPGTKHIRARAFQRVPIGHREAKMFGHRLAPHLLLGIKPFKSERISAGASLKGDGCLDFSKICIHDVMVLSALSSPYKKRVFNGLIS